MKSIRLCFGAGEVWQNRRGLVEAWMDDHHGTLVFSTKDICTAEFPVNCLDDFYDFCAKIRLV